MITEEQDNPTVDDDAETISSTSTADYNREEVEVSLTTISEAFHMIAQEYEKLMTTVPHMSKIQAAQVIAKLPILPIQKQEVKMEKTESTRTAKAEPVPGTSTEQPTAEAEEPMEELTEEVMVEPTPGEKDVEPEEESVSEYFKRYVLTGKGKSPEDKIQEACKEINYRNLIILITVRDYIVNQAKNIKEVAKEWGLSFRGQCLESENTASEEDNTLREESGRKTGGPC